MSEQRSNLGFGLLALIPIVCCIGLPLIAAAGVSVALAALVLIVAVAVLVLRTRRHRNDRPSSILRTRS